MRGAVCGMGAAIFNSQLVKEKKTLAESPELIIRIVALENLRGGKMRENAFKHHSGKFGG